MLTVPSSNLIRHRTPEFCTENMIGHLSFDRAKACTRQKFVMDADQLGALHHLARGVEIDENAQALDAIREVGPGGHYLGCAHTQANFKEAFWKSDLLDYKPFETWSDEGARDTQSLAAARVEKLLGDYVQPPMDPETRAALDAFVAERKAAEPDSFM